MSERPTEPDAGIRRFLEDFRSSSDRREWNERRDADRRSGSQPTELEKRISGRRSGERRVVLTDRRHGTPEQYSHHDADRIRQMILNPTSVACPQCDGDLVLGPQISRGKLTGRQVHCTTCRRSVIIALPEQLPAPLE